MKDEELKNIWNMIHEQTGSMDTSAISSGQFIKSRSGSIQDKIRSMLQKDLIIKMVSGLAFMLNLLFYKDYPTIIYICLAGIVFLAVMAGIEWKTLQAFNEISNPDQPTRDNLSRLLVFLRRKSNLFEITIASSQMLIFVPGLLIYFFLVYGQVKPMTGMSFFVFTVLCLIGTIMSLIRTKSQIKFHIKHIRLCLSDLNENSLEFASRAIEKQRKQDQLIIMLVAMLLIFGFVVFIAVLKSIVH